MVPEGDGLRWVDAYLRRHLSPRWSKRAIAFVGLVVIIGLLATVLNQVLGLSDRFSPQTQPAEPRSTQNISTYNVTSPVPPEPRPQTPRPEMEAAETAPVRESEASRLTTRDPPSSVEAAAPARTGNSCQFNGGTNNGEVVFNCGS